MTAAGIAADWIFLMTDVPCLYTSDPRNDPNAEAVHHVANLDELKGVKAD